jgi:hypothetical protein
MKTFICVQFYLFGGAFSGRGWGAMSVKRDTKIISPQTLDPTSFGGDLRDAVGDALIWVIGISDPFIGINN